MASTPTTPGPGADASALVVLGLSWETGRPELRLRVPQISNRNSTARNSGDSESPPAGSEMVPAVGLELNYRIGPNPTRHCVGSSASSSKRDCFNPPQSSEKTCVNCAVADATFASNLHHAHTRDRAAMDQSVVEHLEQTNILYLAAFRDGSIKVGTSTEHRKIKRWTEQGAWRTVEVAVVSDGFLVRLLEDLVTEKLGLTQAVAVKRKLAGMVNPQRPHTLDDRLLPLVDEVHGLMSSLDRLPGSPNWDGTDGGIEPTSEIWTFPGADAPVWDGLHLYPARLDSGTHHLEIIEMCGRMAVLARPGSDDRFVADIGQLFGIELDLGQYEPDQLAIQDSLF